MKYYGNFMDDVVVREDINGNRFKKHECGQEIGPCTPEDKEAFGGESFGYFHDLSPICEEDYRSFGFTWRYGSQGRDEIYRSYGLSKSKYKDFCQCPRLMWLNQYCSSEIPDDPQAESRIKAGQAIGELAKGLFGDYYDVTTRTEDDELDIAVMLDKTDKCVTSGEEVICEAAFSFENNYCAVDILRSQDGGYAIYEVKSSTGKELEKYYDDIAYQKYVLEKCGINVTGTYLIYVNSDYVLDGALDIHQYFVIKDVAEDISGAYNSVESNLPLAHQTIECFEEPCSEMGEYCKNCPFLNRCSKNDASRASVFDLYNMRFGKKIKLFKEGMVYFEDIKDDKLTNVQKTQIECTLEDKEYIDTQGIKSFLRQLSYPLYFLDFETMQPAIPEFQGTHPYQQIPFQYSLHYIEEEGGELHHKEFLGISGEDPERALAEQLCNDIPMNVCTTAYNKKFECSRLKEMADRFPDLSEHLLNIMDHIIDLLDPFQAGMYYLPAMGGSFSIKKVLPALFPDDPALDYHNLEGDVHNGGEAMNIFPLIKDMEPVDQQRARESLLRYCELDTFAMVKLWEKLVEKGIQN